MGLHTNIICKNSLSTHWLIPQEGCKHFVHQDRQKMPQTGYTPYMYTSNRTWPVPFNKDSGQNVVDSQGSAEWVHKKSWLWWRILVVGKSIDQAKPHLICFLRQCKRLRKRFLWRFVDNIIERSDSAWYN